MMKRSLSVSLLPLLLMLCGVAVAQENDKPQHAGATLSRSKAFLQAAEKVVREFRFAAAHDGATPFERHATPLLHWTNATRGDQEGAVYVWKTSAGLPAVIGTVFVLIQDGQVTRQKIALHTLAEAAITGDFSGTRFWTPKAGLKFRSLEVIPGQTRTRRLIQMRNLARRHALAITYPKSKTATLRLAPQPLFRLESPSEEIEDEALFFYATGGTDPEALLVLKSTEKEGERKWQYAFARFHYWGLEARDGGNVIWTADPIMAMEGNYFNKARHRNDAYNSFRVDERFPGGLIQFDANEAVRPGF